MAGLKRNAPPQPPELPNDVFPRRLYHGSIRHFAEFNIVDRDHRCIWFTPDCAEAAAFATSRGRQAAVHYCYVYHCDVVFKKIAAFANEMAILALGEAYEPNSIGDPTAQKRLAAEFLVSAGFDGMAEREYQFPTVAVFSKEQITIAKIESIAI